MRCNEPTTLSLGTLLSQASDPPQSPTQSNMINSKCGSIGSLKRIATSSSSSSKNLPPPSPTTSVSESNVIASLSDFETNPNSNPSPNTSTLLQSLKFEDNLDVEVQSPDNNSIWDSLFSDQIIDPSTDFMLISSPRRDFFISSPKRDYMVSSPRRDYMVSSPRRDYMVSSPKREFMVSSPKREYMVTVTSPKRMGMGMNNASMYGHNYGYVNGMHGYGSNTSTTTTTTSNLAYSCKGKSQSPLHKVFSNSTTPYNYSSSTQYGVMDTLLMDEYGVYSNMKGECPNEVYDMVGAPPTETAVGGMTATLLECLSMPSLEMDKYGDGMGVGVQLSGDYDHGHGHGLDGVNGHHHGYGMSEIGGRRDQVECGGLMGVGGATTKTEIGDGSSYHGFFGSTIGCANTEQDQDSGLQLVNFLLACAESVAKDDYISARRHLHHLQRTVSPLGDSMQRVASCFADALSSRLSPPIPSSPHYPSLDTLKIYQILYQACPYIKFAHFTANQAIFEAFESEDRVHIIDLDIVQGYQWPAFLQAIAARPGGPPSLRITGVGYPAENVRETGRHLTELAHSLRVPFEFHPAVADRLQDLRPHMLHRRVGEALAVNSVNRLHHVPGAHLGNLLSMIRDQAPNIVTLVEQEASHNGPHFLGRFLEALHYYSAIFDSLDATFPADSTARAKVEQYIFLPEIRNIVACEGSARVERHERLERWRKEMEGRGFKGVPLGQNAVAQSKILLGLYSCDGYRLTEDMGCLLLGWQDRPILAASAWRC